MTVLNAAPVPMSARVIFRLLGTSKRGSRNVSSAPYPREKGYKEHLQTLIGGEFVDPAKDKWLLEKITADNVDSLTEKIMTRGQDMLTRAQSEGSMKNPINPECSMEDIIKDLA